MNRWKENLDIKKSMEDGVIRLARRFFCAFFIVAGVMILTDGVTDFKPVKHNAEERIEEDSEYGRSQYEKQNSEEDESEKINSKEPASGEFNSEDDACAALRGPDFTALKLKNPDIVAWIWIPGMSINEPIVQAEDNEYYLHTDFEGKKNPAGAVFMDFECAPDASDFHSVFYGHHMKNGSRFAELVRLKDEDFFQSHRRAYLYFCDGSKRRLNFIAALTTDSASERRKTRFSYCSELYSYMEKMTDGCKFRDLPKNTVSHLYSFVTCSYEFADARTIVYAVEDPTAR